MIQSQPVVDYIAENKHPIIDFMDQMTIDMNWGITELFGGDGDAYIRNIRDNGYESLAGISTPSMMSKARTGRTGGSPSCTSGTPS